MGKQEGYYVIDEEGKVINVVVWDGEANWQPPKGCKVVKCSEIKDEDVKVDHDPFYNKSNVASTKALNV
jgi:hypothetical protein